MRCIKWQRIQIRNTNDTPAILQLSLVSSDLSACRRSSALLAAVQPTPFRLCPSKFCCVCFVLVAKALPGSVAKQATIASVGCLHGIFTRFVHRRSAKKIHFGRSRPRTNKELFSTSHSCLGNIAGKNRGLFQISLVQQTLTKRRVTHKRVLSGNNGTN